MMSCKFYTLKGEAKYVEFNVHKSGQNVLIDFFLVNVNVNV